MKNAILQLTRVVAILCMLTIVIIGFYWAFVWCFIGGLVECYHATRITWTSVGFITGFTKFACAGPIALISMGMVRGLIHLVDQVEAWRWGRT